MPRDLQGQVALVTGAGQGIGRAIALRLAAAGARVAVNDLALTTAVGAVVDEVGDGMAAIADVADPDAVRDMVARVERELGPIGILVANAAAMSMGPFAERDLADWWRQVHVNLGGTFFCARSVVPGMRRAGGGRIVLISSEWGVRGWPNATAYCASKAGIISLGKTLARELAPEIHVNVIAPGVIDTPQLEVDAANHGVPLDEIRRRYAAATPAGRIGRPEEIAETVAFLASRDGSGFVGQVLQPNGGTTTCMG